MKPKIGLQFFPQPIDKPILFDRSRVLSNQRLGLLNITVQAIQIGEQKYLISSEYAAIFLIVQQVNRPIEVSLRQSSRD